MNILCTPLHGISDRDFCSTGHTWYFLQMQKWGLGWQYYISEKPDNAIMIDALNFPFSNPVCWSTTLLKEHYIEKLNIDLVLAPGIEFCYMAMHWDYPIIQYCNLIFDDEYGRGWLRYLKKSHPEIPIVFHNRVNAELSGMKEEDYILIPRGYEISGIPWQGTKEKALIAFNSMRQRMGHFNFVFRYQGLKYNLGDQLDLVGYGNEEFGAEGVRTQELRNLFSQYRVVINIDHWPGRGMLEAMASGVPVVSYIRDDVKKYGENGTHYYMSDNLTDIVRITKGLLNNKERARIIGENGKELVRKFFSKKDYIMRWNELFKQVVERNKQ